MILRIKYLPNYNKTQWGELKFTKGNSAMDLRAAIDKPITIHPGARCVIPTGISVELKEDLSDVFKDYGTVIKSVDDIELQVRPRSGLSARQGLVNIIGTIDSSYRGEIGAIVYNLNPAVIPAVIPYVDIDSDEFDADNPVEVLYNKNAEVTINPGDRIAQLIVSNIIKPEIEVVNELSESDRGSNGFGSTGVK